MPTSTHAQREIRRFLVDAAQLLHQHGTPAHRMEERLVSCARALGEHLQVFATPTSIEMAFGARSQRPHLVRSDAGEAQLARLVALEAVIVQVAAGELEPRAGRRALRRAARAPLPFGPSLTTLAFAMASAGAARLFGGNLAELLLSFGLGLAIGLLALLASAQPRLGLVFAPLSAFAATALSLLAAHLVPGIDASLTTLAALIVLLPGLSLTLALTELAMRHLVSGTARVAGSLTVFATMAVGVALANALLVALLPTAAAPPDAASVWLGELPGWSRALALLLAPVGFCVLFQARSEDLPAIAIAGIAASELSRVVAQAGSPVLAAFAGALLVGLAANAYAAWRSLPPAVVLLPGLLLLVPGSLGFQSIHSFLMNDPLAGVEVGFRMLLIAVSLVAGVLLANLLSGPNAPT